MKKLMIRAVVSLALAAGAALALASPASAGPTKQLLYHDAATLRDICERNGGYFSADPKGSSYFCVLPDGQVILCVNATRTCVAFKETAPTPGIDGTPPYVDTVLVNGDPGPRPEIGPVTTADVRAVHLAHVKS